MCVVIEYFCHIWFWPFFNIVYLVFLLVGLGGWSYCCLAYTMIWDNPLQLHCRFLGLCWAVLYSFVLWFIVMCESSGDFNLIDISSSSRTLCIAMDVIVLKHITILRILCIDLCLFMFSFTIILLCLPVVLNVFLCFCWVPHSCSASFYVFCLHYSTPVFSILLSWLLLFGNLFSSVSLSSFIILLSLYVNIMPLHFWHVAASWCVVDMTLAGMGSTVQWFLTTLASV